MLKIGVLVSGGGTNLQAIIDAVENKSITGGKIEVVISTNEKAYSLERAKNHNIDGITINPKQYDNKQQYEDALSAKLDDYGIELIVLAGFMTILSENFVSKYPSKIINVHPSLIPSFCGDGFYGLNVHRAALAKGVKLTGATVHYVNEITDGGEIIMQKSVEVFQDDTPEILQKRVMEQAEWDILPKAINMICRSVSISEESNKV